LIDNIRSLNYKINWQKSRKIFSFLFKFRIERFAG
jgi:hypothetical protein